MRKVPSIHHSPHMRKHMRQEQQQVRSARGRSNSTASSSDQGDHKSSKADQVLQVEFQLMDWLQSSIMSYSSRLTECKRSGRNTTGIEADLERLRSLRLKLFSRSVDSKERALSEVRRLRDGNLFPHAVTYDPVAAAAAAEAAAQHSSETDSSESETYTGTRLSRTRSASDVARRNRRKRDKALPKAAEPNLRQRLFGKIRGSPKTQARGAVAARGAQSCIPWNALWCHEGAQLRTAKWNPLPESARTSMIDLADVERTHHVQLGTGEECSLKDAAQPLTLEDVDVFKPLYTYYFAGRNHVLYMGQSQRRGPVAVAVEAGPLPVAEISLADDETMSPKYRVLIQDKSGRYRTAIASSDTTKERLRLLRSHPRLQDVKLVKVTKHMAMEMAWTAFERSSIEYGFKFGVLHMQAGQQEENDIYSNQDVPPHYAEFLSYLGDPIDLCDHVGFRGGLDTRGTDTTGAQAVYTRMTFEGASGALVMADTDDLGSDHADAAHGMSPTHGLTAGASATASAIASLSTTRVQTAASSSMPSSPVPSRKHGRPASSSVATRQAPKAKEGEPSVPSSCDDSEDDGSELSTDDDDDDYATAPQSRTPVGASPPSSVSRTSSNDGMLLLKARQRSRDREPGSPSSSPQASSPLRTALLASSPAVLGRSVSTDSATGSPARWGGPQCAPGAEGNPNSHPLAFEFMFHVAELLPYDPRNPQQVHRKRHIGNDVVVVVFREPEAPPFKPSVMTSQFNHVFLVVEPVFSPARNKSAVNSPAGRVVTHYRVAVASDRGVKPWRPLLPVGGAIAKHRFRDWFRCKLLNAERAAMYAPQFHTRLSRTAKTHLTEWLSQFGTG